jgi:hypothetical protein
MWWIMEKRGLIRLVGRGVFWVAIVLMAFNIENLAAALGYDNVLADFAKGEGFFPAIWGFITSDAVFFATLIMLGVGIAAWADFFAKKWDGSHPTHAQQCRAQAWPLRVLAAELADNQHLAKIPADLFSRLVSRYKTLQDLGFGTPTVPLDNMQDWSEIHQVYLGLMWPILEDGHIDLAKSESRRWACEVRKDECGQLQWPTGTGPETPP